MVCGASQGIGQSVAESLARLGAEVVVLARSKEKLEKVLSNLSGHGHGMIAVDVSDKESLKSLVLTEQNKKSFDILICNTGGPKGGAILEAQPEEFLAGFENHVLVNALLVSLLVPQMKQKNFGRIINIISTSVKIPIANLGVSNTIRGAVASWAKTLSMEVARYGITVNSVLPGFTETPRLESLKQGAAQRLGKTLGEVEDFWKSQIPTNRFAKPEEVAAAVVFLASENAAYINGVALPVDGGRLGCL